MISRSTLRLPLRKYGTGRRNSRPWLRGTWVVRAWRKLHSSVMARHAAVPRCHFGIRRRRSRSRTPVDVRSWL